MFPYLEVTVLPRYQIQYQCYQHQILSSTIFYVLTSLRCSRSALFARSVTGRLFGLSFCRLSSVSIAQLKDFLSVMEYTIKHPSAHCTCSVGKLVSRCKWKQISLIPSFDLIRNNCLLCWQTKHVKFITCFLFNQSELHDLFIKLKIFQIRIEQCLFPKEAYKFNLQINQSNKQPVNLHTQ